MAIIEKKQKDGKYAHLKTVYENVNIKPEAGLDDDDKKIVIKEKAVVISRSMIIKAVVVSITLGFLAVSGYLLQKYV